MAAVDFSGAINFMTCVVLENWCAWLYPEEEKLLLLGKLEESIDQGGC